MFESISFDERTSMSFRHLTVFGSKYTSNKGYIVG